MTTPHQPVDQPADTSAVAVASASRAPASRDGRVLISGFCEPNLRRQLKVLSAMTSRTQEDLLADALKMLFKAHGLAEQSFAPAAGPARRAVARR